MALIAYASGAAMLILAPVAGFSILWAALPFAVGLALDTFTEYQ